MESVLSPPPLNPPCAPNAFRANSVTGEEPASGKGAESRIADGVVIAAHINAVILEVQLGAGRTVFARMTPGRMYLNGRRNLLTAFRTDAHLAQFFPTGLRIRVSVAEAEIPEHLIAFTDRLGAPCITHGDESKVKRNLDSFKKQLKTAKEGSRREALVTHVVWRAWSEAAEISGKSMGMEDFARSACDEPEGGMAEQCDADVAVVLDTISANLLSEEEQDLGSLASKARWFVAHGNGSEPCGPPALDDGTATCQLAYGLAGRVVELRRPHGGIVYINGERVYFHRMRLLVDGQRIGQCEVLEDRIGVGDFVTCDVVNNARLRNVDGSIAERHFEHSCGTEKIALWVFKGDEDRNCLPEPVDCEKMTCEYPTAHRLKIVEFVADPNTGAYNSGVAMVMPSPTTKKDAPTEDSIIGKYVMFGAQDINFAGYRLGNVDLFDIARDGDELFGKIRPLSKADQFSVYSVNYVLEAGALIRLTPEVAVMNGGRLPELVVGSSLTHANCLRTGGIDKTEKILLSVAGNNVPAGMATAVVTSISPAPTRDFDEDDPAVVGGSLLITSGPDSGKTISFDRESVLVFGRSAEKANLSGLLLPRDRVFVVVQGMQVKMVIVGPPVVGNSPDPIQMSQPDRLQFISWLEAHSLHYSEFLDEINGKGKARNFIPFEKESLQANVTLLRTRGGTGGSVGSDIGVAIVEQGYQETPKQNQRGLMPFRHKKVAFHKSVFYVFGRSARKAVDLALLVPQGQKITMEAVEMTEEYKKKYPHIPGYVTHAATLCYIGGTRPGSEKDGPWCNDESNLSLWLERKQMTQSHLAQLLDGEVVGPYINATRSVEGFILKEEDSQKKRKIEQQQKKVRPLFDPFEYQAQEEEERKKWQKQETRGAGAAAAASDTGLSEYDLESLPVLRHGLDVAQVVEGAILSTGPSDPILYSLIQNDDLAHKAHHIAAALHVALERYAEMKRGLGGFGMGRGRGGYGQKHANGLFSKSRHERTPE